MIDLRTSKAAAGTTTRQAYALVNLVASTRKMLAARLEMSAMSQDLSFQMAIT